jgi:hypothetical protein
MFSFGHELVQISRPARDSPRRRDTRTLGRMTRDEATAEVNRLRTADPENTWIATQSGGEWKVLGVGMKPASKPTGTATKPPPVAPHDDPHSTLERQSRIAGLG